MNRYRTCNNAARYKDGFYPCVDGVRGNKPVVNRRTSYYQ